MKILKFGGASLKSSREIKTALSIIEESLKGDEKIAVVLSALNGVTNSLLDIAQTAKSQLSYEEKLEELEKKHFSIIMDLIPPLKQSESFMQLKIWLKDLKDILHGVSLINELSDRSLDFIISHGELFSATIFHHYLSSQNIDSKYCDPRELILCSPPYGKGDVDFNITNQNITKYFNEHSKLQIIPGFIAGTKEKDRITLGRGGSDYTAAIFAAALNCKEIELWKDVDGLQTADPKKVKKAFTQQYASYHEAMELSHFGAKIIYPPALGPAIENNIKITIKNTFNPSGKGTSICNNPEKSELLVKGISSISNISLINVSGPGMVGVAGIASRVFKTMADNKINIILITQSSSEHSISFAIKRDMGELAITSLNKEFELEIGKNLIQNPFLEKNLSILSIVGENLRSASGTAGKIFSSLGKNAVNIKAIAQGSSERNVSFVIDQENEIKALNVLHEEFYFPENKEINMFLVGTGLIASALLNQLKKQSKNLENKFNKQINLIGIINSRNQLIDSSGIHLEETENLLKVGEQANLNNFINKSSNLKLPNSIFVDCTASNDVVNGYKDVIRKGFSIVTPNKKAQTGDFNYFKELKDISKKQRTKFLYETSVGAGLPILSTLNDLIASGDKIYKIQAVLSGTLSYIFNSFNSNILFTDIVKEAKEKGFTEPDPREDLNGLDVARKLLILARECGYNVSLDEVKVENLVPEEAREVETIDEFFKILNQHNDYFKKLIKSAEKAQGKLCYIGELIFDKEINMSVKLETIDNTHPFSSLKGSDNIVSFQTERYYDCPLIVRGPGAGAEVTAAGVFADIIKVVA